VVCGASHHQREDRLTRFILHIGPHKTGTTYIQHTLDALRDVLLKRGVCVPSIWNAAPGVPSHHRLVRAIRNRDLTLIQDQVREIVAQRHRYVVISCEGLSTFTPDQVAQLQQLLGSAAIQVVHYVRRWPERLPSAWQEHVRQGHATTFPEFIVRQTMGYDGFSRPDTAILDSYSTVFGADQIKIVSYSYLVDNDLDIARHFLASFLDLPDIELPDVGRLNQSLSILDTELIRALNAIRTPRGDEWSTAMWDWYLTHKEGLVPDSVLDAMRASVGSICLDETTPPLVLLSRDVLTRYASSLVPPWDKNTLHELRAVDVPFVRQHYLLEPAVPKILRDIFEMYIRGL
jgi:hypothetical protein